MEKDVLEVKNSIYAGMSIYDKLKSSVIEIGGKNLNNEDKKYLSLYLGMLNTDNSISEILKDSKSRIFKRISYEKLTKEKYIKLYNEHFVEILTQIDFNSINNFCNYLLNQEIVVKFNEAFKINFNSLTNKSNKVMQKQ